MTAMKATRTLTALSLALAAALSTLAVTQAPAAATDPCSGLGAPIPNVTPTQYWNGCVRATAGLNVRFHVGTGYVSTSDPWVVTLPYNSRVKITCYLTGDTINGTSIWDAIGMYQVPGGSVTVFGPAPNAHDMATDAYIFTGSDAPVVPHC